MKKIIYKLLLLVSFILITLVIILSSVGIETSRLNNLISNKIIESNNNINLELTKIKFKLDIKKARLFVETKNPQIDYRNINIPTKNIRVYLDFISLVKSEIKIKKIYLVLNQLDVEQLKKISITFKPSNFTSFLNNKIKQGKINTEIEIYFDKNNLLDNFIARGSVLSLTAKIINNINLDKTNFSFFADKSDILLKNIFGNVGPLKISDGDLKLKLSPEISLETNFKSKLNYNNKLVNLTKLFKEFKYAKNIISLEGDLSNNFTINFDETYKIKNYSYKNTGKILETTLDFKKPLSDYLSSEKIKKLSLIDSEIKSSFSPQKNIINISGKYLLNKDIPLAFNLSNIIDNELLKLKLDADYTRPLELELINYVKQKNKIANISINLEKQKDLINVKKFKLKEAENEFLIEEVKFKKNKFFSLKKISAKTKNKGKKNNDFLITYGKKILIKGTQFDASNLPKILSKESKNNRFTNINKEIVIDFSNVTAPLAENLQNFKLIGKIEKGKFIKMSSKGDFGENNFLDMTMKKDSTNKKRYLEIYSDLTSPLLTEFSFFKGLTGGKLLFTSIIDDNNSISKLKIENFNLINTPGVVRLLSLADLGGLADLAEGDGLSFDLLEINMEKSNDLINITEILALGPSISVLMEGYQNSKITSLKGTLVPAKSLNKIISKIPFLGDLVIPKEAGEGLFGVSFKMKGPPGEIKTTINPLRTLTPRFIQKMIDKKKNLNNLN
jgi:hypothetical protein